MSKYDNRVQNMVRQGNMKEDEELFQEFRGELLKVEAWYDDGFEDAYYDKVAAVMDRYQPDVRLSKEDMGELMDEMDFSEEEMEQAKENVLSDELFVDTYFTEDDIEKKIARVEERNKEQKKAQEELDEAGKNYDTRPEWNRRFDELEGTEEGKKTIDMLAVNTYMLGNVAKDKEQYLDRVKPLLTQAGLINDEDGMDTVADVADELYSSYAAQPKDLSLGLREAGVETALFEPEEMQALQERFVNGEKENSLNNESDMEQEEPVQQDTTENNNREPENEEPDMQQPGASIQNMAQERLQQMAMDVYAIRNVVDSENYSEFLDRAEMVFEREGLLESGGNKEQRQERTAQLLGELMTNEAYDNAEKADYSGKLSDKLSNGTLRTGEMDKFRQNHEKNVEVAKQNNEDGEQGTQEEQDSQLEQEKVEDEPIMQGQQMMSDGENKEEEPEKEEKEPQQQELENEQENQRPIEENQEQSGEEQQQEELDGVEEVIRNAQETMRRVDEEVSGERDSVPLTPEQEKSVDEELEQMEQEVNQEKQQEELDEAIRNAQEIIRRADEELSGERDSVPLTPEQEKSVDEELEQLEQEINQEQQQISDNETSARKLQQELNDEAFAEKLQQELDDEAFAQKLQQELDDEALAKKLKQELNDEAFAQKLQQELDDENFAQKVQQELDDGSFAKRLQQEIGDEQVANNVVEKLKEASQAKKEEHSNDKSDSEKSAINQQGNTAGNKEQSKMDFWDWLMDLLNVKSNESSADKQKNAGNNDTKQEREEGHEKVKESDVKNDPAQEMSGSKAHELDSDMETVETIGEAFKNADSMFHRNSKEYKDMLTALEGLQIKQKQISQRLKDENRNELTPSEKEELEAYYTATKEFSEQYLADKSPERMTSLGQARYNAATTLRNFSENALAEMGVGLSEADKAIQNAKKVMEQADRAVKDENYTDAEKEAADRELQQMEEELKGEQKNKKGTETKRKMGAEELSSGAKEGVKTENKKENQAENKKIEPTRRKMDKKELNSVSKNGTERKKTRKEGVNELLNEQEKQLRDLKEKIINSGKENTKENKEKIKKIDNQLEKLSEARKEVKKLSGKESGKQIKSDTRKKMQDVLGKKEKVAEQKKPRALTKSKEKEAKQLKGPTKL